MSEFSFSRTGLTELTNNFSANLKDTKTTFAEIKSQFTSIESQWQGGDSEKATAIFHKINESFDKIGQDLEDADRFIQSKAEAFNNLHFNG